MKAMTPEKILIIGAREPEISDAEAIFISTYAQEKNWIMDGIKKGWYQAHTLCVESTPKYVIVWHKNDQSVMHVNAIAQINGGGKFETLVAGMKAIAKKFDCRAIEGLTVRQGLIKKLMQNGFRPVGVTVLCEL